MSAPIPAASEGPDPILLSSVLGNSQRLDGGAMFGNVPRALWSRWCPPDEANRIGLCCRALLVETQHRRVLLEAGIGAFFPPELRARYGVIEERHVLIDSLATLGLRDEDITDVVLSHLHFDHAGGVLAPYQPHAAPRLLFQRARFFVGEAAFRRAQNPHPRDRASFIKELPALLLQSGRLHLVSGDHSPLLPFIRFRLSDGHTPGLLISEVSAGAPERSVVFASDLVPGTSWVHPPVTMGYDRYPELLIDEKLSLFKDLAACGAWLFYTHDPGVAMSRIRLSEDGKAMPIDTVADLVRRPL